MCRDADSSDCDLPEYCNGDDYFCPTDVYKRDGTNCTVNGVSFTTCVKPVSYATKRQWTAAQRSFDLSPVHTVAENGGCRRKRRENGDSRRIRRQSHFSATVWTGLYVDVELRRTVVGPGMSFKLRVSTILSLTTIPNLRKQIKEGHRLTCVYRKNGHKIKYMYFVCGHSLLRHSQKDRKIGDADGVRVLNVRHNWFETKTMFWKSFGIVSCLLVFFHSSFLFLLLILSFQFSSF